jgi:BirA family biotin operon repressor/biotin-[acetyl-CoA-carboxylase] ligase
MTVAFDGERFRSLLGTLTLGRECVVTALTDSTNDDALAAARAGARHGALFVTDEQRHGRGRRGNSWHAPPGEALLFSVVLRPELAPERASSLALVAGLAVRAAVANVLASAGAAPIAQVKWPNDVVVDRLKVAGVLVESQMRGEKLGAAVVGVGLNVGRVELPADVRARATSLAELGARVTREELLGAVLGELEVRLSRLERDASPLSALVTELSAYDALEGEHVVVGEVAGTASGIDTLGNLKVLDTRGVTHKLSSGHVTVKTWP